MNKIKKAIFDVDSVLVDYRKHFYDFCCDYKGFDCSYDDFCKNLPEDMISEFNCHNNFANMEAISGTKEVLKTLYKDNIDLYVLSSCYSGNSDEAKIVIDNRIKNLSDNYGDIFQDIMLLELGGDKSKYLDKFDGNSTLFIDDYLKNFNGSKCINVLADYCNRKNYLDEDIIKSGFKIDYHIYDVNKILDIVKLNNYEFDIYQQMILKLKNQNEK